MTEDSQGNGRFWWIGLLIPALIANAAFIWWPRPRVREDGFFPRCSNHLKFIALRLHNYHEDHGQFPPAYVADKSGNPMHSWRVLLLPYLNEGDLFSEYNFEEPWDGPGNSRLADQMSVVFGCPEQKVARNRRWTTSTTNYLAVVGPDAAFAQDGARTRSDFKDNTHFTVMIVEATDSDVNWLEPRDLAMEESLPIKNAPHEDESSGLSAGPAVFAAFADGTIRLIPSDISPATLKGLITINGGEPAPQGI